MRKILFILILQNFVYTNTHSQSFSVDELISLSRLPSKNIDPYLKKKGFVFYAHLSDTATMGASFKEKLKSKTTAASRRSIDINIKDDSKHITLHTSALEEYISGQQYLIKAGYFYDNRKDISKETTMLFQKANITIKASWQLQDSIPQYRFDLLEKSIPTSLTYAEDLLRFDSHQFLVSFFGEQNVRKDMYFLSENELKRCSVLFNGTRRQAVFVWDDEVYLNNIAYIMFTNKLPTKGALKNDPLSGNNEWQLKNGIHTGMSLKELLKINESDFEIYGNNSEMAFLVKPNDQGKVNFKKVAIMFGCHQCFAEKIFNQNQVSALEIVKADLPLRVLDVVIYP